MPNVPVEMLNFICADYDHLNNITFPQIRDNSIGVLIGADAFIATVPLKFTTGPPGTPYGVLTQLGWTVTGPIPQKYKPTIKKNQLQFRALQQNKKPRTGYRERHAANVLDNGGKKFSGVYNKFTHTHTHRKPKMPSIMTTDHLNSFDITKQC